MGPMESLKSAFCLTRGDMPKEEPMRKQALDLPLSFTSPSFAAKPSLESSFPSGVKTQNQAPLGILLKISSASFSRPALNYAGEGYSGRRTSGSSSRLKRQ